MRVGVGGRTVFAAAGGRPSDPGGPTVLFLHGAGMDHTVWAPQRRDLARHGCAALAVDLPGHGRSEGPPLASIAALADWLGRLRAAVGLERVALVGHSMGALVALAAARPAGVERLALLGIAARMPVNPDLLAAARADSPVARDLIVSWAFAPPVRPRPAEAARRLLEQAPPGVLATDLAACDAYTGAETAAARVACPALLLLGADDRMTPPARARPLAERLPSVETVTLPGAGHLMMLERPAAVTDALRRFLVVT